MAQVEDTDLIIQLHIVRVTVRARIGTRVSVWFMVRVRARIRVRIRVRVRVRVRNLHFIKMCPFQNGVLSFDQFSGRFSTDLRKLGVCMCVCVRVCVCVCVHARACVRLRVCMYMCFVRALMMWCVSL